MKITTKQLPWILLIIVVALFGLKECNSRSKIDSLKKEISLYQLKEQVLTDSLKNKDGQIVKLQEAVVFEGKKGQEALSKYADSVFNLRKKDEKKYKETVVYYENYIRTHLPDTVWVPYDNPGVDTTGIDSLPAAWKDYVKNSIRVPSKVKKNDPYFQIEGIVVKEGLAITNLNLSDTITGRFVEKKHGWFKSLTIEYQVMNKNPYVKIDNSKSAIFRVKKKPFKFLIPLGIGIATGLLIK